MSRNPSVASEATVPLHRHGRRPARHGDPGGRAARGNIRRVVLGEDVGTVVCEEG